MDEAGETRWSCVSLVHPKNCTALSQHSHDHSFVQFLVSVRIVMVKRKRVPAALHAELTEYSFLIRALRANNALDVTSKITHTEDNSEGDVDDDRTPSLHSRDTSPESDHTSSCKRVRHSRSASPTSESAKRDIWTRWPLLMSDVPRPSWSIEDEMSHLVEDIFKKRPRPLLPAVIQLENEDRDNIPSLVPNLTNIVSNYLSSVFALLAAHTPNRSSGQQNRIQPMGWRTVLDVLCSSANPDIADPKCIFIFLIQCHNHFSNLG